MYISTYITFSSESQSKYSASSDRNHGKTAMGGRFVYTTSKSKQRFVDCEQAISLRCSKIVLLFWKTTLLVFGNLNEIETSKAALRNETDIGEGEHAESFITASPLDYHLFRQEITSKYPAYNPPPPLVPIELENNSILPPLPSHASRQSSHDNLHPVVGSNLNNGGGSIFHQPVHIATPAPSPPPSPAGPGGKGGKKQNYQTNQNFPFLYPPLDDSSNTVGGKGNADRQDQLVGKKWEGSDVPASILEAGQLFASRMRMSRSIRQLWDVRENYIRYERGWNNSIKYDGSPSPGYEDASDKEDNIDGLSSDAEDLTDQNLPYQKRDNSERSRKGKERSTIDEALQIRLDSVDEFYVCDPYYIGI